MNRREGCVLAFLANCSQDFWKIRDKTTVNLQARFCIVTCYCYCFGLSNTCHFGKRRSPCSSLTFLASVFFSQIKEEAILLQLKALMFSISLEPQ